MQRYTPDDFLTASIEDEDKRPLPIDSASPLSSASFDKCVSGWVIISGQDSTSVRITTRVQRQEHEKALRILVAKSQSLLNLTPVLTHNSKATLPSEDISHTRVQNHSHPEPTRLQNEFSPHDNFIYNRGQIEMNFFKSRNCYATLSSFSSRATLQLIKQLKIATYHLFITSILTIWIQFQRL